LTKGLLLLSNNSSTSISIMECVLAVTPHPASSILNRSLAREILEHAVRNTTRKLFVFFHDDTGTILDWQRRNEEIAWYNEIYNMCVAAERPAINMVILPRNCGPKLFDAAYGLETHRDVAAQLEDALTTSLSTSSAKSTKFFPVDEVKSIRSFLGNDYFMYEDDDRPLPVFKTVAMGGTFDNLHAGHKRLLTAAARVCAGTLTIGVTSDIYLAKKQKSFGDMIEPCSTRIDNVVQFLKDINPVLVVDILPIDDGYGPTIQRAEFEGIVASSETLSGCRGINVIRSEKGWTPMSIVIVARTDEGNLSSTAIRKWKHEQQRPGEPKRQKM
jgi:pantetheine-phosphate adenylyltransferase